MQRSHALKRLVKQSRRRLLRVEFLEPRMCLALAVPAFSSLAGANHTIYLDFDGHVTTGTTWNTGYYGEDPINSPAWSLDSDRLNFSDSELATIERIWQRVAEDFSPFNVNVTTVEPPLADLRKGEITGDARWGVRAVVTIETTAVRCGCGGIAYIGSFNDLYDEPVFVYNSSESGVAEAISHEVGHSLFLAHDGTNGADLTAGTADDVEYYSGHGSGSTSWAPIMGSSYNRNVTTWDNGEYYNTSNTGSSANYGNGADDLNVITTRNGFGYRSDENNGTLAGATPLTAVGTAVSGGGLITTRTDVDAFSFSTGAGLVTLNINPAALRANLDLHVELLDALGNVVATSNPPDALNASFSLMLAAGNYALRVDGAGFGTPSATTPTGYSDYASIGQYTITGTVVDPGVLPQLIVDDVTLSEASGAAAFVVRLTGAITQNVTVSYGAVAGTATAPGDFTAIGGVLTFTPGGPTTQTVTAPVVNDALSEPTETFELVLSNASANAAIADGRGVATVTNDDAVLTINDVSVTEGNVNRKGVASNTTATFTVSLAHPVNRSVSAIFATAAGNATGGVDYQNASGLLTIPAGQSSGAIPITVIGDNTVESNETFSVVLTSTDTLADGSGTGTIIDNDSKKGGGGPRNGPAAANYDADFTLMDHADAAEPTAHGHFANAAGDDHDSEEHHHQSERQSATESDRLFADDQDLFPSVFAADVGWVARSAGSRSQALPRLTLERGSNGVPSRSALAPAEFRTVPRRTAAVFATRLGRGLAAGSESSNDWHSQPAAEDHHEFAAIDQLLSGLDDLL